MPITDSALPTLALGSVGSGSSQAPATSQPSGIQWGTGAPSHVAPQGTIYVQIDGGIDGVLWVKQSGGQATPDASGWGTVSSVKASSESTGNTGAVANAINFTPPAVAGTYELIGVVNVTAWTTPASFTVQITYKDASGVARTDTATVSRGSTGATAAAITAVDRWYFDFPAIDIDNSGTAITLSTTGTFTGSPVYNLAAVLRQIR